MSKRALVFQHMAEESGNQILDLLGADGIAIDVAMIHEGDVPATNGHDLLVVLGGTHNTWEVADYPWLAAEMDAIRDWVAVQAKPYFGICLGHQLLAEALGGKVSRAATGETGLHPLARKPGTDHPFFSGVPDTPNVMQWHIAEVAAAPQDATVLASSPTTDIQAIAIGDHALSTQFHLEWTHDAVANWPQGWKDAMDTERGPGGHAALLDEIRPHMPAIEETTRQIYRNFVTTTGLVKA